MSDSEFESSDDDSQERVKIGDQLFNEQNNDIDEAEDQEAFTDLLHELKQTIL